MENEGGEVRNMTGNGEGKMKIEEVGRGEVTGNERSASSGN